MTGKLYINGRDAFTDFGVFVHDGAYNELVSFPAMKDVTFNDWPEEDGVEVDLSAPRLDSKTFNITFCCVDTSKIDDMIVALSWGVYHEFDFREIGVLRVLRLVSNPDIKTLAGLGKFTFGFADDFPLNDYDYVPPTPIPSATQEGFEIDGERLSTYGIWVLEGSRDNITQYPTVKQNLLVNTSTIQGAIYESEDAFLNQKDVDLKCLLKAPDAVTFWNNYNALLFDLTRPGERGFYFAITDKTYPCYYKNSQVDRFAKIGPDLWCEFTLTLAFTSFTVGETLYLLAAEDGALITTEDGQYYINTAYNGN